MKTPREVLLARHTQAEPRLDEIRRKVLAAMPTTGSESLNTAELSPRAAGRRSGGAPAWLRKAWLELIWPSRRAWAGMAALWLAVLAMNIQMKATSPTTPAQGSVPLQALVRGWEQQQRLLAELLPSGNSTASEPRAIRPPRPNPRPRSEGPVRFKAC